MIRKGLIERLFDAASIQRWNDHIRPVKFTELDKQAHKMIIAYVLARLEETDRSANVTWSKLIQGGVFEFLQRAVLTDIKPPVFYKMVEKKGKELNEAVLKALGDEIKGLGNNFEKDFTSYLFDKEYSKFEKKILRAAHYLATNWEFRIIYNVSSFIYGIDKTKEAIENEIEDHYDLIGVQKIWSGKRSYGFIDLCGQLRFQQRWAHSPRVPETSVLGHMLMVAILTYFCSLENEYCPQRLFNNFFGGLFHDLPEALTRDIIDPVKRSIEGLEVIIKEYERIQIEEKIFPLIPPAFREEIKYFVEDEFSNKIKINGEVIKGIPIDEINTKYNTDQFSPIDGELIQTCDALLAYIEAALSIEHGIVSKHLRKAKGEIYEKYKGKIMGRISFGNLLDYFGGE